MASPAAAALASVPARRMPAPPASLMPDGPAAWPAAQPAPAPGTRIVLAGLQRARDGRPVALLAVDGGPRRRFIVGDAISVGVRLQRIERDAVVLQRGRAEERVPLPPGVAGLPDAAADAPRPPPPSVVAAPAGQGAPPAGAVERAIARVRAGRV
jgi:hypothetical protein